MKKAIVRGNALLRVILPALLLVFGLQLVSAQVSTSSSATPLDGKAVMMELMNANLVSDAEAVEILSTTYKDMWENANPDMTQSEEMELGIRAAYYKYLIEALLAGGGLQDVLSQSVSELNFITVRYKNPPEPLAIFQATVSLLSQ